MFIGDDTYFLGLLELYNIASYNISPIISNSYTFKEYLWGMGDIGVIIGMGDNWGKFMVWVIIGVKIEWIKIGVIIRVGDYRGNCIYS